MSRRLIYPCAVLAPLGGIILHAHGLQWLYLELAYFTATVVWVMLRFVFGLVSLLAPVTPIRQTIGERWYRRKHRQ